MNVATETHPAGFPIYTLTSGDDKVRVSAFGAQILSWTKGGIPIVFENRNRAIFDGKTPYRGGAPICFPIFGMGTLLPLGTTQKTQHGHARTTVWESHVRESDSALVLTTHQPSPDGYGPTDFSCELSYLLAEDLSIEATVRNIGDLKAPFQFAIHTYWATEHPSEATVQGLGNSRLDNLLGLTEHHEEDSSVPHPAPFDRVYLDAAADQTLTTDLYQVKLSTEGCSGTVLWNPGPNHPLHDLGSPDFICLESGQIVPSKTLNPGEAHVISVRYEPKLT